MNYSSLFIDKQTLLYLQYFQMCTIWEQRSKIKIQLWIVFKPHVQAQDLSQTASLRALLFPPYKKCIKIIKQYLDNKSLIIRFGVKYRWVFLRVAPYFDSPLRRRSLPYSPSLSSVHMYDFFAWFSYIHSQLLLFLLLLSLFIWLFVTISFLVECQLFTLFWSFLSHLSFSCGTRYLLLCGMRQVFCFAFEHCPLASLYNLWIFSIL